MKRLKILIAAGGTGGHLFPAQQLAEMLEDCDLLFAGHKLQNSPFFEREKIPFEEISSAPTKRIIPFAAAVWKGFWQSVRLLRKFQPDAVVGFGSFHSFPLLLASAVLGKRIVLFEANCILGKVNRFFAPAAQKIACQFPVLHKKRELVPFLPWKGKQKNWGQEEARKAYGLDPNLTTVLVFGGSQGAAFLNQEFPKVAERMGDIQVIHLTGLKGKTEYRSAAVIKEFEKEMARAYAASDFVVCRAGAGTMAELIRYEKPALLIPYPFATDDHQRINGEYLAKEGGAKLLVQREATVEKMAQELQNLREQRGMHIAALQKLKRGQEKTAVFSALVKGIVR